MLEFGRLKLFPGWEQLAADIRSLTHSLLAQGVDAEHMMHLISALNDQLTTRVVRWSARRLACLPTASPGLRSVPRVAMNRRLPQIRITASCLLMNPASRRASVRDCCRWPRASTRNLPSGFRFAGRDHGAQPALVP
jgi:hypothetical protein